MISDCHIHSSYSADSKMPPGEACRCASNMGIGVLTFTEHLDYDYPGYEKYFTIDYEEYFKEIDRLSAAFGKSPLVLKGIEAGIQPHVAEKTALTVRKYNFDLVIGSIHIIGGKDPYISLTDSKSQYNCSSYYENLSKNEAYSSYLHEIISMLNTYNEFDVLGHFDYITRYAPYSDRSMKYSDHQDIFDEIFKKIIKAGKGLEVNSGSYRERNGYPSPAFDLHILARYRELGGEIICFGSDAHDLEYIAYKWDAFVCFAIAAGFSHAAYYKDRKPVFFRL